MAFTSDMLDSAAAELGPEEPVYMVNMLRYHSEARYGAQSQSPPISGRDAYFTRYAPAFAEVAKGEDYGLFWVGNARGVIVGDEGETWDDIVVVRYANLDVLRRILSNPRYADEADPHREAAVAAWKFIVTTVPPRG